MDDTPDEALRTPEPQKEDQLEAATMPALLGQVSRETKGNFVGYSLDGLGGYFGHR